MARLKKSNLYEREILEDDLMRREQDLELIIAIMLRAIWMSSRKSYSDGALEALDVS
jgi:hypothetical protein